MRDVGREVGGVLVVTPLPSQSTVQSARKERGDEGTRSFRVSYWRDLKFTCGLVNGVGKGSRESS